MHKKKTASMIALALFGGGLIFSMTSAAAGNWYPGSAYATPGTQPVMPVYRYAGNYRFRPLDQHQVPVQRYQPNHFMHASGRHQAAYQRYLKTYLPDIADAQQYRMPRARYAVNRVRPPAFARQFGWSLAGNSTVRTVRQTSHFASSVNNRVEQSAAPEYYSQPINTQGFRYRVIKRNAPFVSFSQRVNAMLPSTAPAPMPPMPVTLAPSRPEHRSFSTPALHEHTQQHRQVPPALTGLVGPSAAEQYRFRPMQVAQQRLPSAIREPVETAVTTRHNGYHLADAKQDKNQHDFLDNWSFRPVESNY